MTKVIGYFYSKWRLKEQWVFKETLPLLAPFPRSGLIQWHYKAVTVYLLLISDCWSDRFSQASSPCSCSVTWDEAVCGCAKWLTLLHYQWGPITFRGLLLFCFRFGWLKKGDSILTRHISVIMSLNWVFLYCVLIKRKKSCLINILEVDQHVQKSLNALGDQCRQQKCLLLQNKTAGKTTRLVCKAWSNFYQLLHWLSRLVEVEWMLKAGTSESDKRNTQYEMIGNMTEHRHEVTG